MSLIHWSEFLCKAIDMDLISSCACEHPVFPGPLRQVKMLSLLQHRSLASLSGIRSLMFHVLIWVFNYVPLIYTDTHC